MIIKIPTDCDLTVVAYEAAIGLFNEKFGVNPTTVAVSPLYIEQIYKMYFENPTLTRLLVVPIPGLDSYAWMVLGSQGIIYSPGA